MSMKDAKCEKCGSDHILVSVECGNVFLGYLCAKHSLEYNRIMTRLQEEYFQKSIDEFEKLTKA